MAYKKENDKALPRILNKPQLARISNKPFNFRHRNSTGENKNCFLEISTVTDIMARFRKL